MKRWRKAAALLLAVCLTLALPLGAGAANETVEHAYALNDLGLFQGTDSGFELDKRPTRLEGMTMFVRLLGGEEEALEKNYAHPFADVPGWGDPYVGYAWEHGLTNGTGKTTFGSTAYITLEEYVTFVLRALGYDDSQGDFTWKTSVNKAVETGLLTGTQASQFLSGTTSRGTMVDVSYNALTQKFKSGEQTLAEKLVEDRVFTRELAIQKGVWTQDISIPTESAKPTTTPRPTATPRPTDTPRPTAMPRPTDSPKPVEPPKPTESPAPSPTPGPEPEKADTLYGIVTSFMGIRRNSAGDDLRCYTVAVGRNKDVQVFVDCGPDDLKSGTLVMFEEQADSEYVLGEDIFVIVMEDDTVGVPSNGRFELAAVREYRESGRLLTYYTDTNRGNNDEIFEGGTSKSIAVDKDVAIFYVDADSNKQGDDIGVQMYDCTTGYANAVFHINEEELVDAIIVQTSGNANLASVSNNKNVATSNFGATAD